jgi:hypothetical protein
MLSLSSYSEISVIYGINKWLLVDFCDKNPLFVTKINYC